MKLRELTFEEHFPHAIQQDLLTKQSEHFVNKSIAEGNIAAGYKNMPTELYSEISENPLVIHSKPPKVLIGTYIKNNWRIIVSSIIIGGVLVYILEKTRQKRTSKRASGNLTQKTYYL